MDRVVVVDRAGCVAEQVRSALTGWNGSVRWAADHEEAVRALRDGTSLLVMNPCVQPDMDFGPFERLALEQEGTPLAVIAGCAPMDAALRVLFPTAAVLRMPLSAEALRRKLLQAANGGNGSRARKVVLTGLGKMVGSDAAMQPLYRRVLSAARSEATVLLTGETGTGKDLVARTIHDLSPRRDGPFLVVSCAELAETLIESEIFGHVRGAFTGATQDKVGLFEAARGGTVFLDEVADASPAVQARLLRVVEERRVRRVGGVETRPLDVRLVASSQADLGQLVDEGRFRADLLYRLRVLRISLPPLRERPGDIPALVALHAHGLAGADAVPRLCSPLAFEALKSYHWPGNVRELLAVLEAAATLKPVGAITPADLPHEVRSAWWAHGGGNQDEAALILKALEEAGGRRGRAAEILGLSRTTLWRRLKELGIPHEDTATG